ncbi:MAG: OmpH family outer membrane protein [Desulfovibrionales bacterium]|nr:OmpH family outer membrane protein [Desulfovibrionales bacterium]
MEHYWIFAGVNGLRSLKCILLSLVLVSPLVQAAGIAVINANKVIDESAAAQAFNQELTKQFSKQRSELAKLESSFQELGQKLERDGAMMSESERAKIELEMRQLQETYRVQGTLLQRAEADARRKELNRLAPVLREAVDTVAKAGGYDYVLESGAVHYAKPGTDITGKVIEQINKLTSKK